MKKVTTNDSGGGVSKIWHFRGDVIFEWSLSKNWNGKYSQELVDYAKQSVATLATKVATDTFKTASKKAIQKIAEWTGNLLGNEIRNKITRIALQIVPVATLGKSTTPFKTENTGKTLLEIPNEIYKMGWNNVMWHA